MLKHHLLLHVDVAVPAARKLEVTFNERACPFQDVEHFCLVHRSSSMIASAAARGSSACVMGRPITKRSAPASRAPRGVCTRACSLRSPPDGRTPGVTIRNGAGHTARTADASVGA